LIFIGVHFSTFANSPVFEEFGFVRATSGLQVRVKSTRFRFRENGVMEYQIRTGILLIKDGP